MLQFQDVKQLLEQADAHTLSLYLTVDSSVPENQATTPAWRTWLKNRFRELDAEYSVGDSAAAWRSIRQRVEDYLSTYAPTSKGLVLLYGPTFEQVYELQIPFDNQASFGRPLVTPLLWAIDEFEPYLIVMVDKEKAYFITANLGSSQFLDSERMELQLNIEDWAEKPARVAPQTGESVTRGSVRDEFQDRVVANVARFHRDVAGRIPELLKKQSARRLVIGGDEQAAHAVYRELPEKLAENVVAVHPIPMRANTLQILDELLPLAQEFERQQEMALVNEVIDLAKSGGRGAIGRVAVQHALEQQRVELLIMPWPMDDQTLQVELPLQVLASGGRIELVHGEAADRLHQEGGLAARLYYTL